MLFNGDAYASVQGSHVDVRCCLDGCGRVPPHCGQPLLCQDHGSALSQGSCKNNYLILLVLTQAKKSGLPVPKVLGLSASLVIRAVKQVDEFRTARAKLEQMLDAEVETAEELSLTKYVSSANEEVLEVPRRIPAAFNRDVVTEADEAQKQLRLIKMQAEIAINAEGLVSLSIS